MSDDIVTRLREVAVQEYKDGWVVFPVCDRAADEIEGLRAERDKWRKLADSMAGCLDSSMDASDALDAYEQAVRGEQ